MNQNKEMSVKKCQRCQQEFDCLTEDIKNCHCNSINLQSETKEFLSKTFYDCLCSSCLQELDAYSEKVKQYPFPENRTMFVPEVHYYIEGQYWVFTEFYHYGKGRCCGNNCRHCAYGFKYKKGGFN